MGAQGIPRGLEGEFPGLRIPRWSAPRGSWPRSFLRGRRRWSSRSPTYSPRPPSLAGQSGGREAGEADGVCLADQARGSGLVPGRSTKRPMRDEGCGRRAGLAEAGGATG